MGLKMERYIEKTDCKVFLIPNVCKFKRLNKYSTMYL